MDRCSGDDVAPVSASEDANQPRPWTFNQIRPGDRMKYFVTRTSTRSRFAPDTMAGRYQVYCFFLSGGDPVGRSALDAIARERSRFNDQFASLYAFGVDQRDEASCPDMLPGVRFCWDTDRNISRLYGAAPIEAADPGVPQAVRRTWIVLDPMLHVAAVFPFDMARDPEHRAVFSFLDSLPPPDEWGMPQKPPPIIIVPNVFEPEVCRALIDLYDEHGGAPSGFVRDNQMKLDPSFKVRRDFQISDPALVASLNGRISRRVIPEVKRLFFMDITRIDRQIVACYGAEDGGHFRPHRDNTPGITEHRRFAVSINLTDDFEGGEVCFPEYQRQGFKVPPGWAIVFPCAVLHAVTPVTAGRRYAYLPFLYDEAGAALRQRNLPQAQAAQAALIQSQSGAQGEVQGL